MPDIITDAFRVSTGPLPSSRKVYIPGKRHPDIRVAQREIDLEPGCGEGPVAVYDSSGPYTDPAADIDIRKGLPPLRAGWIAARGDVEPVPGRPLKPEDNGHRPHVTSTYPAFDRTGRSVLRARKGCAVTQLAYARAGIITPEMEYVAIRENLGRDALAAATERDGEDLGAAIPTT